MSLTDEEQTPFHCAAADTLSLNSVSSKWLNIATCYIRSKRTLLVLE